MGINKSGPHSVHKLYVCPTERADEENTPGALGV